MLKYIVDKINHANKEDACTGMVKTRNLLHKLLFNRFKVIIQMD